MTKNLYYTEELGLRALLIEMGQQIDAIKNEIADLKNNPQPPKMNGGGQLGLFGASQGTAVPNWRRIQFLEIQLLKYCSEYAKVNNVEMSRRMNSMAYVAVEEIREGQEQLLTEILQLIQNLGGEEKEALATQVFERFKTVGWMSS